jgi:hypothetical protein
MKSSTEASSPSRMALLKADLADLEKQLGRSDLFVIQVREQLARMESLTQARAEMRNRP